ncbi:MAG: hypothetical protein ACT4P8_12015 [Betaproteobacteria bacterium]
MLFGNDPANQHFRLRRCITGLERPLTEPMYFRARSSKVFALGARRMITDILFSVYGRGGEI